MSRLRMLVSAGALAIIIPMMMPGPVLAETIQINQVPSGYVASGYSYTGGFWDFVPMEQTTYTYSQQVGAQTTYNQGLAGGSEGLRWVATGHDIEGTISGTFCVGLTYNLEGSCAAGDSIAYSFDEDLYGQRMISRGYIFTQWVPYGSPQWLGSPYERHYVVEFVGSPGAWIEVYRQDGVFKFSRDVRQFRIIYLFSSTYLYNGASNINLCLWQRPDLSVIKPDQTAQAVQQQTQDLSSTQGSDDVLGDQSAVSGAFDALDPSGLVAPLQNILTGSGGVQSTVLFPSIVADGHVLAPARTVNLFTGGSPLSVWNTSAFGATIGTWVRRAVTLIFVGAFLQYLFNLYFYRILGDPLAPYDHVPEEDRVRRR